MERRSWIDWAPAMVLALLLVGLGITGAKGSPDPASLAAELTEHLTSGRFAEVEKRFDEGMRAALPAGGLEAVWQSLGGQLGEFLTADSPYVAEAGPPVQVRQPASFANGQVDLLYAFDAEGRLSGFWVVPHLQPPSESRAGEAVEEAALPPYADPARFTEVELTFGRPPYELLGTLTLPPGPGPFPGVVLIHGSGPNDRDETLGPNKPFRDLAWGLANQGIAVFRYDKRTLLYGSRMAPAEISLQTEVIEDALAAVDLMAARPEISQVYVVGHSLGATLAPTIAGRSDRVAGLVLLAGMARRISQVLPQQVAYIAESDGMVTAQERVQVEEVQAAMRRAVSGELEPAEMVLGAPAAYWQELEALDPVAAAQALDIPMLILQGGRDYQVTEADFTLFREGLAGQDRVAFRLFPALNHLFMAGSGPSTPDEYQVPGHVAPAVVEHLAGWLLARAAR